MLLFRPFLLNPPGGVYSYEPNWRRYIAGVKPVARRNARVKLDCEENPHMKAISSIDVTPAAIIVFARSSRLWLT